MDLARALQQKKRQLNNVDPPPQSQSLGNVGGGQPTGDTSKLKSIELQMLQFNKDKNDWVPQDLVTSVKAPKKLNIISYNIWIFEEDREARINALVKHFEGTKADLIALVETTVPATKFLQNHQYIRDNYYMSLVTQQSQPTSYKTCLLSRFPFSKLVLWDIPWSHRKVTAGCITFEIHGGKLHTIEAMAVHLDSDYAGHNKRSDQLQWLYSKTRQVDTVCIMGDYNFHIDSEDKFFEDTGYSDMWKVVHGTKSGNTFDRHRLDRICLTNYQSHFKPKSMHILSSVVPGCKTLLSDHSGLHCELKIVH